MSARHKRFAIRGLLITAFALSLAACNTVRGVGTDIHNAADTTERAIDNAVDGN
ncbi:MAG: entericidin EcnA/B family protein [Phycisphaeraceae bacterium]|nr:MAG: entericidin EcnA/B family protein [Phycisphaeraceae bacterium]